LKNPNQLPVLSESSVLRYVSFSALYLAQGLPNGLLAVALPAWLVAQGKGTAEISIFLTIAWLPWSFKLIAGPIMDRFSFLPMGRRRPWVLGGQISLLISFMLMATIPDPVNNILALAWAGFLVNLCASFQDVAVDGLAIDLLPTDQQARANGFMWGSKAIGGAVAAAIGSIVLSAYGFSVAILIVAGFLGLIIIFPLFLRERPGERLLPWTSGKASALGKKLQLTSWGSIARSLFKAVSLPMSLLATICFFVLWIGEGILYVIMPVLTVGDLGWLDTDYSQLMALSRLTSGILGMIVGATVIDRLGHTRSILMAIIPLILLTVFMGAMPDLWSIKAVMVTYIILRDILVVTITIAFFSICMGLCWQRVAASQFALYMAISNFSDTIGVAMAGVIDQILEYNQLFYTVAIADSAMLVFLWFLNSQSHQQHLKRLDSEVDLAAANVSHAN